MAKAQGGKAQGGKAAAKKRIVKVDSYGDAHVTASFNNIIISLTNKQGQVISCQPDQCHPDRCQPEPCRPEPRQPERG